MYDFTNCKQFAKTYGGANGNKLCIEYKNQKYMLKIPSKLKHTPEAGLSQGCLSEYIGCHIYNLLGIEAQETELGVFSYNDNTYPVVVCKDFAVNGWVIQDFASLKNQVINSAQNGYGTELKDILLSIEEQTKFDVTMLTKYFWDMFVTDAFLGNFDRHNGNWGFLYNENIEQLKLAPIFDCGSCLYPQATEDIMTKVLNNENELDARIYVFPASAIKINDKKLSYYQYLTTTTNKNCLLSIADIYSRIDMNQILDFVNGIDALSDLQKQFYTTMLQARYDKIIIPAYEHSQAMLHNTIKTTEVCR